MQTARINFFGGTNTVTGSNFLFESKSGVKVIVDCGLFQGFKYSSEENYSPFPYDVSSIDYLFITHAHIDHIGRIPKLVRDGFRGKIYSTPQTKQIAEPMLEDAFSLMKMDAGNRHIEPLYSHSDIAQSFAFWQTLDYRKPFVIGELQVELFSAGHILGSAMVKIRNEKNDKAVLFTGDMGNKNNLLLDEADIPEGVDYLVCESVYGDRNHESSEVRKSKLVEAIKKANEKKGILIIPTFSLERTQHLLFEINNLLLDNLIPSMPVYLDSPLAIKLTEIYRNSTASFKKSVQDQIKAGDDIFDFPKLNITIGRSDSEDIYDKPSPKIILAGSGMSMGGRVVSHEKKYLSDPKNVLLFVGYQSAGSLGRRISEGQKEVDIMGERVHVRADVMQVEGYSSHRDSDGLVEFVENINPKKVFVVMGEPKSSTFLAQKIREELGIEAIVPEKNSSVTLEF